MYFQRQPSFQRLHSLRSMKIKQIKYALTTQIRWTFISKPILQEPLKLS